MIITIFSYIVYSFLATSGATGKKDAKIVTTQSSIVAVA